MSDLLILLLHVWHTSKWRARGCNFVRTLRFALALFGITYPDSVAGIDALDVFLEVASIVLCENE